MCSWDGSVAESSATSWPMRPLREVTVKIGSGATPRGGSTVYTERGTSLIRSQNVLDGDFSRESLARITDEAADQLRGVTVEPADVLMNITGESVTRCCVVPTDVLPARVSQHVAIIRPTPNMVPKFLQAFLVAPETKARLNLLASNGATRRALTKAQLQDFYVPAPPMDEQRAIAEVLGALDDKIAANAESAEKADALASLEFQAAVTGVSFSERTFDDLAEVRGGGTPSRKVPEYWNGSIAWASPTDITALPGPYIFGTSRTITEMGLANCSSSLYPPGSILMTSRATIGAFALAQVPVAVNQGFIVLVQSDDALKYWLFHEMRSRVDEFLTHANGATFLELSRGNFRRLPVRLAERPVIEAFGRAAGALHERAASAYAENRRLAATRDALLPALMSGRLRVREAEEVVADVV